MGVIKGTRTDEKVFERAINARRNITATYYSDFGFSIAESIDRLKSEEIILQKIRDCMISQSNSGRRLFKLNEEAGSFLKRADEHLSNGMVAAVDGTVALPKTDFVNTAQFAVAVGHITSRDRGNPDILITYSSSAYADPERIKRASSSELQSICDELDEARDLENWPTTFLQYEEHLHAIRCASPIVILDGPIFTHNLIVQKIGRDLLQTIIDSDKILIGVIKHIGLSWAMCRWCAAALQRGEAFILGRIGECMKEQFTKTKHAGIASWLDKTTDFVRVVYRPAEKSFAFECREKDVGLSCALLQRNQSPTINHELPLLLETIDSQLRAGFDASAAQSIMLGKLMRQKDGYRSAVDAINEREFR